MVAAPRVRSAAFSSFWSTATGWGTFGVSGGRFTLEVIAGKLPCRSVEVAGSRAGKSAVTVGTKGIPHRVSFQDQRVVVMFADAVELGEGERLTVTV